ncbi:hypothetical protein NM688_g9157 [Phlebia brevispora]|uniref:Uncharacterized protein n=1 Tax=Phlebia brevispora TaxID=194682 RepID=A0ACC1RMC7_9APHY|nr:hypothetical protein NM688_g9157 [Phlebia brevispora]
MTEFVVSGPPEVDSTFGVLFIGFIFGVTLYGLTFFQTYVFYSRFPNESVWVECMVGLLWAIDTATTALLCPPSPLQTILLSDYKLPDTVGQTARYEVNERRHFFVTMQESLRRAPSQDVHGGKGTGGPCDYYRAALLLLACLYSDRQERIYRHYYFVAVQLSDRELISALVTPSMKMVITANECIATICDILIVGSMHYFLSVARNPEMRTPADWFEWGIVNVVNRGTSFTVWQCVLFLTFVAMPHSQVWILFHFIVSKVYVNTLLSMLNSRKASRGRGVNEEDNLVNRNAKGANAHPAARSMQVDALEFERHQNVSLELGPMSSPKGDLGRLNVNVRPSSMDSETLRGPISPMSMKASTYDGN